MAIDIFPVWASENETPDLIHVGYDDCFGEALAEFTEKHDSYVMLEEEDIEKLKKEYPEHAAILNFWLQEMERRGQGFVRVVLNY